jgi:hypothetical protein
MMMIFVEFRSQLPSQFQIASVWSPGVALRQSLLLASALVFLWLKSCVTTEAAVCETGGQQINVEPTFTWRSGAHVSSSLEAANERNKENTQ